MAKERKARPVVAVLGKEEPEKVALGRVREQVYQVDGRVSHGSPEPGYNLSVARRCVVDCQIETSSLGRLRRRRDRRQVEPAIRR